MEQVDADRARNEARLDSRPARNRDSVQSLLNGLAVLRSFDVHTHELGLIEITRRTGLPKRTVLRLVNTLQSAGYLVKNERTRQYRPGVPVLDLGFAALSSLPVREAARPYLESLLEPNAETVSLAVLDGPKIVYTDHLKRTTPGIRLEITVGSSEPAIFTAVGKAMLAALPEARLDWILAQVMFTRRTPMSVASAAALRAQIEEIRQTGFAVSDQEHSLAVRGVGAAIRDRDGTLVGGIGVLVLVGTSSLDDLRTRLGPRVRAAAEAVSSVLGYRAEAASVAAAGA